MTGTKDGALEGFGDQEDNDQDEEDEYEYYEEEGSFHSSVESGEVLEEEDEIYKKQDIISILCQILKVAIPTMVSSVLGQVTYVLNIIVAG